MGLVLTRLWRATCSNYDVCIRRSFDFCAFRTCFTASDFPRMIMNVYRQERAGTLALGWVGQAGDKPFDVIDDTVV